MTVEMLETRRLMAQVQSLVLVNANTDRDIGELKNGATINVAALGTRNLNIRAVSTSDTQSVRVRLDGKNHIENREPYTWAGDDGQGDYYAWRPNNGSHEFVVTAFTQDNARGTAGTPLTVRFTVVDQPVSPTPAPTPTPTPTPTPNPTPNPTPTGATPPPVPGNWSLNWSDEFNDTSLDGWKTNIWWSSTDGMGDERTSPANVSVSGGTLNLTATKSGSTYSSGLVTSEGLHSFQYGYVEARMKFPSGVGFWPAFWMLPTNHNDGLGEIDIMEWVGNDPNSFHANYHVAGPGDESESQNLGFDLSADWHTYGVNWQRDKITWYIDGKEFHSTPNYTNTPLYVILNLAVGGSWPGTPNSQTQFPSTMKVDYVRVWDLA